MQSQPLRARKSGLITSHGVPSSKSDIDACQHFWEGRLGTCVEGWIKQKQLNPTIDTSPVNIFSKNNQDPTLMIMNRTLTVP